MKKSELKEKLKKIKTTCLDKIKSEQFRKDSVFFPLLAGLALVGMLAAAIAGIRNISSGLGYGQMESMAASATNSFSQETTSGQEEMETDEGAPDGRKAHRDCYLVDPNEEAAMREAWPEFEVEAAKAIAPGALSGIYISGEPAEFYMLSIAGESSGGQLVIGDRGQAYGLCQFDYRYDLVNFMRWAYERHPSLWPEFEKYTEKKAGDESLVKNAGILQAFVSARSRAYEAAISDELEFLRMTYWDSFAARMNAAGYQLSERHIAVSAAFFSVNVNCSSQSMVFLEQLSPEMTDAEMICEIYRIRNTILSEQNVGRGKKGTTLRYQMAEPRMALDLLHGFITIDSVKNYGGGVQWNGNLFVNTVLTSAVQGMSMEWEEALLATPADAEVKNGQAEQETNEQQEILGTENAGAASAKTATEEPEEEQKVHSDIVVEGRRHAKEKTEYSAAKNEDSGNADTVNKE